MASGMLFFSLHVAENSFLPLLHCSVLSDRTSLSRCGVQLGTFFAGPQVRSHGLQNLIVLKYYTAPRYVFTRAFAARLLQAKKTRPMLLTQLHSRRAPRCRLKARVRRRCPRPQQLSARKAKRPRRLRELRRPGREARAVLPHAFSGPEHHRHARMLSRGNSFGRKEGQSRTWHEN